jgi:maleylpyruvate isomerase
VSTGPSGTSGTSGTSGISAAADVLALIPPHTERLLETARALDDPGAPSLCEGWSRGHVLTHVARNADGLVSLVGAVVDGTGGTMYASRAARDADIDAGAGRPVPELVADVEQTAVPLADALPRLAPEHADRPLERTPGDVRGTAADIPLMRLRELVFHHVDLDAGFGFDDLEPDLLRLFLDEEVQRVRAADDAPDVTLRTPDGDEWTIGLGTASVTGSRAALLGWLARGLTTGLTADHLPRLPKGR